MGKVTHPQLIKIVKNKINGAEINSVNSRDVYEYLEIDTRYNDWIKRTIEKYDFVENEDYVLLKNEKNPKGGRPELDYIVTIDMAKELCMVANTTKGKQVRKYFIQVEKELSNLTKTRVLPENYIEALKSLVKAEEEKEKLILENKHLEKTKAYIGNKREATAMNTASIFSKGMRDSTFKKFLEDLRMVYDMDGMFIVDTFKSEFNGITLTEIDGESLEEDIQLDYLYDEEFNRYGEEFSRYD